MKANSNILFIKTSSDAHLVQALNLIDKKYPSASKELLIHSETVSDLPKDVIDEFTLIHRYPFKRGKSIELGKLQSHCTSIFSNEYDLVLILTNNKNGKGYENIIKIVQYLRHKKYALLNVRNKIKYNNILTKLNSRIRSIWKSARNNIYLLQKIFLLNKNKIDILQMPVIEICDSRCQMCNIWKNKNNIAISVEQYREILSDPIFRDVERMGINGGEPTLREDLTELVNVMTEALPNLKAIYLTTNGIRHDHILTTIRRLFDQLKQKNIHMDVCVSLDGDESTHDKNRGTKGSYKSSVYLIQELIKCQIPVWVAATLTKHNLYAAADVLMYANRIGIRCKVRLAVDIKRLNNQGYFNSQKYNDSERFHLIQLFQKLHRETSNIFYYSLFKQLAYGHERIAGCSWKYNGVTIDSQGNLSFCSVASPILGSCLKGNIGSLLNNNKHIRKHIAKTKCHHCMHDLSGPLDLKGYISEWQRKKRQSAVTEEFNKRYLHTIPTKVSSCKENKMRAAKCIIITGWWGTETSGDKAILGELFHFLKTKAPNLREIYITSCPEMDYVVEFTIRELKETNLVDVSLYRGTLPLDTFDKSSVFKRADYIIMGGGPIQQIRMLIFIEKAFVAARKRGMGTLIFGCGIHPILGDYEPIVKSMLLNAQNKFFRDTESLNRYQTLTQEHSNGYFACDPAIAFVDRWKKKWLHTIRPKEVVSTLLRANTSEYLLNQTQESILAQNNRANQLIAQSLDAMHYKSSMLAMHFLWLGGDDRINNRQIEAQMKTRPESYSHRVMSLHELLMHIAESKFLIVSRYHAHLFALALNVPFLSIDYTGKGNKIESFLKLTEMNSYSFSWGNFQSEELINKFNNMAASHNQLKRHLQEKSQDLLKSLTKVYESID